MTESEYFKTKIEVGAESFFAALSKINLLITKDAGEDWNGCPEINITHHYVKQYGENMFINPPFKKTVTGKYNNHFDAFAYDEELGWAIIVEAKRLMNISTLDSLLLDAKRIDVMAKKKNLEVGIPSLLNRLRPNIYPKKVFALLLTEVWQEGIKLFWESDKETFDNEKSTVKADNPKKYENIYKGYVWDKWYVRKTGGWIGQGEKRKSIDGCLNSYQNNFHSVPVGKIFPEHAYNTLYCCYAFKELDVSHI